VVACGIITIRQFWNKALSTTTSAWIQHQHDGLKADHNAYLVITGDELRNSMQGTLTCELSCPLQPFDHSIEFHLGPPFHVLLSCLHLFPDWSRNGEMVLQYLFLLASLLVKWIVPVDV